MRTLLSQTRSRVRLPILCCNMPLRAKTTPATMGRTIATNQDPQQSTEDVVLFGSLFGLRTVELNRPKKLNSLNGEMIDLIRPRLQEYQKSTVAQVILLKGRGEKAFCAGGDVAALAQQNSTPEGVEKSISYFADEYQLDHYLATYDKPIVSFLDGITMGGGVGLSIHSPLRVVTERTKFAMPETGIGLFPDVGASYFLSRLDGEVGTYLGLTGSIIAGGDCLFSNIGTHYLHSSSLAAAETRLSEVYFAEDIPYSERIKIIDNTLSEYVSETPPPPTLAGELRTIIDFCFSPSTMQEIMERLQRIADAEQLSDASRNWASTTIKTLRERSPTSLHATLRLIRLGKTWTLSESFQREHALASHFMASVPDFVSGVSAKLITKSKDPVAWAPASIEDVQSQDIDALFAPRGKKLQLLTDRGHDQRVYTHRNVTGLPYEDYIATTVQKLGSKGTRAVTDHVVNAFEGRVGARQKVQEVLIRKIKENPDGSIEWV